MEMDNNGSMEADDHGSMEIDGNALMQIENTDCMDVENDASLSAITLYTPVPGDNGQLVVPEAQPSKRRRKKSIVWEHFTIETIGPGCTKACCKHCKKSFAYITGSKLAGTSHLKRHIALGICPVNRQNNLQTPVSENKGSSAPSKRRYRTSPGYATIPFNQERCSHEIAKMIIKHDYPLHIVEQPGFIDFVRTIQPQFNMVSFNTVHADCVAMYLDEKKRLSDFVGGIPGRVSLTLDLLASDQAVGYAFLMGQFIDSEWILHRRLLNVLMVPSPDSEFAFNQPVAACLSDWGLERKLASLTVDRSIANEMAIGNLRGFLSVRNPLVLNGQLLIGNCYARIISRIAQDALGALDGTVKKIRDNVKYVKMFDSHEDKFNELKKQLQLNGTKDILVDDQMKWNTTYQMLLAASEVKQIFWNLESYDPDYKIAPSEDDWNQIEILCMYLKFFFDAANILTGPTYPTANAFFHEVSKLQLELTRATMSQDSFVRSLIGPLKEKFEKYWNECFLILSVAVIMDPRFKMKLIEFSFQKIYGEDAGMWIKAVDDSIHELYLEYSAEAFSLPESYLGQENLDFSKEGASQDIYSHGISQEDIPQVEYNREDEATNGSSQGNWQLVEYTERGSLVNSQPREGHHPDELLPQDVSQPMESDPPCQVPIDGQNPNSATSEGHLNDVVPGESNLCDGRSQQCNQNNGQPEIRPANGHLRECYPQDTEPGDSHLPDAHRTECDSDVIKSQEGHPKDMQESQSQYIGPEDSHSRDAKLEEDYMEYSVAKENQSLDDHSGGEALQNEKHQGDHVMHEQAQAEVTLDAQTLHEGDDVAKHGGGPLQNGKLEDDHVPKEQSAAYHSRHKPHGDDDTNCGQFQDPGGCVTKNEQKERLPLDNQFKDVNIPDAKPQEGHAPGPKFHEAQPLDNPSERARVPVAQSLEGHATDIRLREGQSFDSSLQEGCVPDGQLLPEGQAPDVQQQRESQAPDAQQLREGHDPDAQQLRETNAQEAQLPKEGQAPEDQQSQEGHAPESQQPQDGHEPESQQPHNGHEPESQQPLEGHAPKTRQPSEGHAPESQEPQEGHAPESQQPQEGGYVLEDQKQLKCHVPDAQELHCGHIPGGLDPQGQISDYREPKQEQTPEDQQPQESMHDQSQENHVPDVQQREETRPLEVLSDGGATNNLPQGQLSEGCDQMSGGLSQGEQNLGVSSQDFPLITIADGLSDFEIYISEISNHQHLKSELDQYLEESLLPRAPEFDILGWWKLNRTKFPTLSKMASDILSIPFCTVAPDNVFDTRITKMDKYRSSLGPVTLEALICAKDWLQYRSSTSEIATPP